MLSVTHDMQSWMKINWKEFGRKRSWSYLKYCLDICLAGVRETINNLSKVNRELSAVRYSVNLFPFHYDEYLKHALSLHRVQIANSRLYYIRHVSVHLYGINSSFGWHQTWSIEYVRFGSEISTQQNHIELFNIQDSHRGKALWQLRQEWAGAVVRELPGLTHSGISS
jgi:hypothetical protein